jgi:ribosome-associated protein
MPNEQSVSSITAIITTEYIELDKLLKRENLTASGGEARYLISQGLVQVNGALETRKRRKLYAGDVAFFNGVEVLVVVGI